MQTETLTFKETLLAFENEGNHDDYSTPDPREGRMVSVTDKQYDKAKSLLESKQNGAQFHAELDWAVVAKVKTAYEEKNKIGEIESDHFQVTVSAYGGKKNPKK